MDVVLPPTPQFSSGFNGGGDGEETTIGDGGGDGEETTIGDGGGKGEWFDMGSQLRKNVELVYRVLV